MRKSGPVWLYNFREYTDGKAIQRCITVGPVSRYKTGSAANQAVELMRLDLNTQVASTTPGPLMTISLLVQHYREHELADLDGDEQQEDEKASSTKDTCELYLRNYIVPAWGDARLNEVKTVAVESWLRGLTRNNGSHMAKGTKAKIRNLMHALYTHAVRYEFTDKNPISYVRQSGKREKVPVILGVDEFQKLLASLERRERTMVLIAAGTGLRRSELVGLQWGDIDFERRQANVNRSYIHATKRKHVGQCKTEVSHKPVPLDHFILNELKVWRQLSEYRKDSDWVFASSATKGQTPLWPSVIMRAFIEPAAKAAGIDKHIGWHTFRHSYTSLLKANGEDIKVVQELLRHANSRTTMDVYAQALTPAKRKAQSKVVEMLVQKVGA